MWKNRLSLENTIDFLTVQQLLCCIIQYPKQTNNGNVPVRSQTRLSGTVVLHNMICTCIIQGHADVEQCPQLTQEST